MTDKLYLILENGTVFEGKSFGAKGEVIGELVFTTGMTGYIETLTDPSYFGQIVLQTFPLIGNYGIIPSDFESDMIGASAYIVKHPCPEPSNFRSVEDIDTFLKRKGIVGLCDVDTRALTRIIREKGVLNAIITPKDPSEVDIEKVKAYRIDNPVKKVSSKEKRLFPCGRTKYKIALLDFGSKRNIMRELIKRSCDVWVMPHDSTPEEILSINPDGIVLSNGPGDPKDNVEVIHTVKELLKTKIPMFGICLGHQLMALASGFQTGKLKYGHRGANQPVKDTQTGKIYMTSQNHGYAVLTETIDTKTADMWFINLNDNTCEGLIYKDTPALSVQFHPEACAGPCDTEFLFDRFISILEAKKNSGETKATQKLSESML